MSTNTEAGYARSNDVDLKGVLMFVKTVWEEVLEETGIEDDANFFELGGHSMNGVRIFSRINKEYGLDLPVEILFEHADLNVLASYIYNELFILKAQGDDAKDYVSVAI